MAHGELYKAALERATQPDTRTDRNERQDIPAVGEGDRKACETWLRNLGFLCPGKDDATWETIKANWVEFLAATSSIPDASLAPNRKVARFDSSGGEESAPERKQRFHNDRRSRMFIQATFWNKLDLLEGLTQRWPRIARTVVSSMDKGHGPATLETLASVRDLDKRRQHQAVWTSMVTFLQHSYLNGSLEEMGLKLDEDQCDDVMDVMQLVATLKVPSQKGGVEFEEIWASVQPLLTKALLKEKSTARNNPLVWWVAILVRSAISGEDDFISSGRFNRNPIPMDLDIRGRVGAIVHYSKVFVLDYAFNQWGSEPLEGVQVRGGWLKDVQNDLNSMDMNWLNDESGGRPDPSADRRTCSSAAWESVLGQIRGKTQDHLGGTKGTAMHYIRLLEEEMGE